MQEINDEMKNQDSGEKIGTLEERLSKMEKAISRLVEIAERLTTGEPVSPPSTPPPFTPQNPTWSPPSFDPEKVKELLATDPIKAFEAVAEYKVTPLIQALQHTALAALDAQIVKNKLAAQQRYSDWHEYADKIAQLEEALPDKRVLAQPNSYDALYAVAKGFKSYELLEKAKKGEIVLGPQYFAEKEGKVPRKVKEVMEEETPELSDEEKFIAQKFGMTEEEYRKWGESVRPSIVEELQKSMAKAQGQGSQIQGGTA